MTGNLKGLYFNPKCLPSAEKIFTPGLASNEADIRAIFPNERFGHL